MRELWRKSFELFRRHPVLWAPYVCAELLAFCLSTLRRMATKPILLWFARTTTRSALGGESVTYDFAKGQRHAFLAIWPLDWGVRYVNVCLLTAALMVTACLIAALVHGQRFGWKNALSSLRIRAKSILVFALKLAALMLVSTAILILPVSYVDVHWNLDQTQYFPAAIGGAIVTNALIAWIVTPMALRLLQSPGGTLLDAQRKKLGRYSAVITVFVIAVLEFAIPRAESRLQLHSNLQAQTLFALNDLANNLPFLLLFIVLALLALEVPLTSEPPMRLPESIRRLMPLHYPPADEPK